MEWVCLLEREDANIYRGIKLLYLDLYKNSLFVTTHLVDGV